MSATSPTTVIIPVYSGFDATMACLRSVVRHAESCASPFDVVLVDDDIPDPDLRSAVEQLCATQSAFAVEILRNATNQGFVRSVNRAMRMTAGDVVLLNSDTVVTDGWLDRLHRTRQSADDVATVTPLTNEGSLCTLPTRIREHFGLDGTDPKIDQCADFIARHTLALLPEVISGVGFCMLITRDAIDSCGVFDEETFGRGYGEEVDFCLRATRMGFRHLVDDTSFVYHQGGVSFGGTRVAGLARSGALLNERYRFFGPTNRRERFENPLAVSFEALVLGLEHREDARLHVLHIMHMPSAPLGGTERHVEALIDALAPDIDGSILHPVESGFLLRVPMVDERGEKCVREYLMPGAAARVSSVHDQVGEQALELALEILDIDVVHIHNLIGHSLAPLTALQDFPGPVVCTLHDLYLACPNHSLLYRGQSPCGIPNDLDVCASCLPATDLHASIDYLRRFRREVGDHLEVVDRFVVADVTAWDYFQRAYGLPEERVSIIEHGSLIPVPGARGTDERAILDGPLRLAFVGRGWHRKGLGTINALSEALAGSDVELHHFGPAKDPVAPRVHVHGAFDNEKLPGLLRQAGIHIVVLPGPYAETYSYVMSEALAAGLPVIGAGFGALGHRIRRDGVGWTIDPQDRDGILRLVENLDRCRPEIVRASARAAAVVLANRAETASRYGALYGDMVGAMASGTRRTLMLDDERARRHLRALASVNRQLQAQVAEPRPSHGRTLANRSYDLFDRAAPRVSRYFELAYDTAMTARDIARSAKAKATSRSKDASRPSPTVDRGDKQP